jgi:hypothetical protein
MILRHHPTAPPYSRGCCYWWVTQNGGALPANSRVPAADAAAPIFSVIPIPTVGARERCDSCYVALQKLPRSEYLSLLLGVPSWMTGAMDGWRVPEQTRRGSQLHL